MINLSERLSEFSYGYGVTKEMEIFLASKGLKSTPFLPSLIHEKKVGFDVAFSGGGTAVMLQFKLGQELKRFRTTAAVTSAPKLSRPFWRFNINTQETQFRRLLRYQNAGASVLYSAPRFSSWREYEQAFQGGTILRQSLLIRPSAVHKAAPNPGPHRVIYDKTRKYVFSDPVPIEEVGLEALADAVNQDVRSEGVSLADRLQNFESSSDGSPRLGQAMRARIARRAVSQTDALAAMIAMEAWLQGAQTIFVTPAE